MRHEYPSSSAHVARTYKPGLPGIPGLPYNNIIRPFLPGPGVLTHLLRIQHIKPNLPHMAGVPCYITFMLYLNVDDSLCILYNLSYLSKSPPQHFPFGEPFRRRPYGLFQSTVSRATMLSIGTRHPSRTMSTSCLCWKPRTTRRYLILQTL